MQTPLSLANEPYTLQREISVLTRLSRVIRRPGQPDAIFREVCAVAAEAIGFRLFTIMAYDAGREEVERVFSNMPDVYPPGGRKRKSGTPWAQRILADLEPFRATTPEGLREAFDDHAVMTAMGLGSILNIPVAYNGRCVGTMNLTHVEGWYAARHEATGLLLGAFLAPALLAHGVSCAAHSSP
ncbi:GAF domain-containing protein [Paraburkholderia heleia]|uniref:GAF domain-containing protein n=1 Tax=Paraburkholderia heleia TaxID=634127 RepID=UPI0006948667|nr:GAF domain-containing protein [Paraburkholderia heleia]